MGKSKDAVAGLVGEDERNCGVVPSGVPALDEALGVGGYPRGRIIEIAGPEGEGDKLHLAFRAIAEAQRAGITCALVDAEHRTDMGEATKLGVDSAKLLVSQPDSGEQAFEIIETFAKSGAVGLVVIDSIGRLIPQAEIDGVAPEGLHARLVSQALRRLTATCFRTGCTVLVLHEQRLRGRGYGGLTFVESSFSGNALKFYASVRLDVRRVSEGQVRARVVKNKCAAPFREAVFAPAFYDASAKRFASLAGAMVFVVLRGEKGEGGAMTGIYSSRESATRAALGQVTYHDGGWVHDGDFGFVERWVNGGCDFVMVECRRVQP